MALRLATGAILLALDSKCSVSSAYVRTPRPLCKLPG